MTYTTVTVSVPRNAVSNLLYYAAQLASGEVREGSEGGESDEEDLPNGRARAGFGRVTVRKNYFGGVSDVWRPMLEMLAENAGEWVSWTDICEEMERTPREMSGAIGAGERRCKRLPPYEKRWVSGIRQFRMPESVAEVVLEAAEETE